MSENEGVAEAPEVTGDDTTESNLTLEDALKELAKVRKEAASKRVQNRDLEEKARKFEEWEQSQMTELEKAQARIAELETGTKTQQKQAALEVAQAKYGFDDEDLEFLRGDTPEQIKESAAKLAKKLKKDVGEEKPPGTPNPNLFPGTRGTPVGHGAVDHNAILRAQMGH